VDWSQEAMWESGAEYPDWSPEDIAFVNDMTREAQAIMGAAEGGMALVEDNAAVRKALQHNIQIVNKYIQKREKKHARTYLTDDECGALAHRLAWLSAMENALNASNEWCKLKSSRKSVKL